MYKVFLFLAGFSVSLLAEWDSLFLGGRDPAVVENVHVITGHLNLQFEDEKVVGPISLPITRTYCSNGTEVLEEMERKLKKLSKTLFFECGWSIQPHHSR
jgi:hypothetical protein